MSAVFITHRDGTTEAAEFIPAAACENALRRKKRYVAAALWRQRDPDRVRMRNRDSLRRSRARKREARNAPI